MKKHLAILVKREPVRLTTKGWEYETQRIEVEVMAEAKGYAMVRRKGCFPFVAASKDLTKADVCSPDARAPSAEGAGYLPQETKGGSASSSAIGGEGA